MCKQAATVADKLYKIMTCNHGCTVVKSLRHYAIRGEAGCAVNIGFIMQGQTNAAMKNMVSVHILSLVKVEQNETETKEADGA